VSAPLDTELKDRAVAWYRRWPTIAKVAFWVLGGGVVFVIAATLWGIARPLLSGPPQGRAIQEADALREREIAEYQEGIDEAEAERAEIREERAAIAEEKKANADRWREMQEALDRAGSPDDVDRIYERIRQR